MESCGENKVKSNVKYVEVSIAQHTMELPEVLWRFPTREAIDKLAHRFNLPNEPNMQDWEWEVADPQRINEFLAAYISEELTDNEKFTLMEIILQSFEDLNEPLESDSRWDKVLTILDQNIALHLNSVYYWSALDTKDQEEQWRVTPFLRLIIEKHRAEFTLDQK